MKAIEVNNLSRNYDKRRAVDHLRFEVEPGEIFGYLGLNGAGKTTTIKLLSGLLQPTSGTAKVAGWDVVAERDQLSHYIGVVFEDQNLYPRLSVRENLVFNARLYGVDKVRVEAVIQQMELEEWAEHRAGDLSVGIKQCVLIARAALHHPKVIFLDEPSKGLDPGEARAVRKIMHNLSQEGLTIFLSTHNAEEADQLSSRVAILTQGRIAALGPPSQLKNKYGQEGTTLEDVFMSLSTNPVYL